ncbi:MAG: hypothetical protein VZQ83_10445, partial [Eubacterium sp.]|nr:hypothetical protein [Eubacterium sp.]
MQYKRKGMNRRLALALIVSLVLGIQTPPVITAHADTKPVTVKSKIELSKSKLTVYVGKTKKLTMENADKKVSWSMDANADSLITFKKTTDQTVTIKGLKKGEVTVFGTIEGKTYSCVVKVKKAAATATPAVTATPKATATPKTTKKPKATATAKPKATA